MNLQSVSNRGFRVGDNVIITSEIYVTNGVHKRVQRDNRHGIIVSVPVPYLVRVEWETGDITSITDELLTLAPKKEEQTMATLGTARVNIKLNFEHESTAEQIEQFRDRLIYAGFKKKQANKIATKAFTLAEPILTGDAVCPSSSLATM